MKLEQFKKELLEKESFRKEYYKKDIRLEIAEKVIEKRLSKNKTQKEVAKLAKTEQPSIARVESGNFLPSLKLLQKIAKALDSELSLDFIETNDLVFQLINFGGNYPSVNSASTKKDSLDKIIKI